MFDPQTLQKPRSANMDEWYTAKVSPSIFAVAGACSPIHGPLHQRLHIPQWQTPTSSIVSARVTVTPPQRQAPRVEDAATPHLP